MTFENPSARTWTYSGDLPAPEVLAFHQQLPDYNVTPLVPLPSIAKELGVKNVLIKDESTRFGLPAFKILGASWAIYNAVAAQCGVQLPCSIKELAKVAQAHATKLVTCTDGNFGRAAARMAKYLGIGVTIFVPKFMDEATRAKIAGDGATVVPVDGDYDVAVRTARLAGERGEGLLVMDVSFEGFERIPNWVVEGYSTMLAETDQQLEKLIGKPATHVVASVGVGSWAEAVVKHYKAEKHRATVIAVEPDTAACLQASLRAGEMTSVTTGHTIMDGLNCGTVSFTSWQVLRYGVDASVTVSDLEAHRGLEYLHSQGVLNGPCGAATLPGLRRARDLARVGLDKDSVVVLFSTEGARDYVVPE